MAEIILKNSKKGIYTTNNVAKNIRSLWLDDTKPQDTKIAVGNWAGLKSEIKQIVLDEEEKKAVAGKHWVIFSLSRQSNLIFKCSR
jgi:hypothetical protein